MLPPVKQKTTNLIISDNVNCHPFDLERATFDGFASIFVGCGWRRRTRFILLEQAPYANESHLENALMGLTWDKQAGLRYTLDPRES